MRSVRILADLAHAEAAASHGDLPDAIALARPVLSGPFSSWWSDAVRILSFAALMTRDDDSLRLAVDTADRAMRTSPGPIIWAFNARHRLQLLEGQPSAVHPHVTERQHGPPPSAGTLPPPSAGTLWLVSRETIDAGAIDVAIEFANTRAERSAPHHQAVVAAVEAAATGNENRWHDALRIALEQGCRLIAVDAFEGLAVCAAGNESWSECLRLVGAAERLRDETGYKWRFAFEQRALTMARTTAVDALGDHAETAINEGHNLDWRDAATYARRARGERKRPRHGWASLTPTEQQVVALVAEGLTNPQNAERLLMGRATVKTHLTRIFAKLGVQTRSELAAEAARRTQS